MKHWHCEVPGKVRARTELWHSTSAAVGNQSHLPPCLPPEQHLVNSAWGSDPHFISDINSHCWDLPGLMKTISFGLCCEIEFLKYQLSPRREHRGNEEHPLHGLLICAPASWASAAPGRTQGQPRASGLIKDPDCWPYEEHLGKKLGKGQRSLRD